MADQYSAPACESRSSHARCFSSAYRGGSFDIARLLYCEQTACPVPRLPLWLSSETYFPASSPSSGSSSVSNPNSTKWFPDPDDPSCFHALSFISRVTRVTLQSASSTGC